MGVLAPDWLPYNDERLVGQTSQQAEDFKSGEPVRRADCPAASSVQLRARRRGARASVEIAKGYIVVAARGARPRARLTAPMPLATVSCAIAASPGR